MRNRHLAVLLTALGLFALLGSGCSDQTTLLVEVTSEDIQVPAEIDALRFDIEGASMLVANESFPIDGPWPHSIALRPGLKGSGEEVRVRVEGLRGGAFIMRRVILTRFQSQRVLRLVVSLQRSCMGVVCDRNTDCVSGVCGGSATRAELYGEDPDGGAPPAR